MECIIPIEADYTNDNQLHESTLKSRVRLQEQRLLINIKTTQGLSTQKQGDNIN